MSGPDRLRHRPDFVRFWTAFTVSSFGTYVTTLALSVIVVQVLHEGATEVGVVSAARWVPYLVLGVVAGVLVDRARRRPILVVVDAARGLLLLVIPLLALLDVLSLGSLVAVMVVFGLLSVVNDAAWQSMIPRLVPPRRLPHAHSRLDASDAVAQAGGPAVAGGLVALLTAPGAVVVDAASYLVAAALVGRIRIEEPPGRRPSLRGIGTEAAEGLRWTYAHPVLRWYAAGSHVWFVFWAATGAVVPVFALRTLDLGAAGFGVLTALAGAGAVGGSILAPTLGTRFGPGRVVITGYVAAGLAVGLLVLASPGTWWPFAAGQLLLGAALGVQNANELGYRQLVTPDRLQARMNANLRSTNRAMIVLGAPLGGLLADAVGLRPVLVVAAGGFVVVGLLVACTPYRRASFDDVAPEHAGHSSV
ncbi:MFS transporter [Jatrophihabitans fulvus]